MDPQKPILELIQQIKEANDTMFVSVNSIGDIVKKSKNYQASEQDIEWAIKAVKAIMKAQADLSICCDVAKKYIQNMSELMKIQEKLISKMLK